MLTLSLGLRTRRSSRSFVVLLLAIELSSARAFAGGLVHQVETPEERAARKVEEQRLVATELARVSGEELRIRAHPSYVGPAILLTVGSLFSAAGIFGVIGASTSNCSHECAFQTYTVIASAAVFTMGAGLGITGGVWAGDRGKKQVEAESELERRGLGRENAWPTLDYGVAPTPAGFSFQLRGSF